MTRIILSSLALAAALSTGVVIPVAAGSLSGGQQTTSCDCSNCSAQHCQGTGGGDSLPLEEVSFNYGKVAATGRDPLGPSVVFVGGKKATERD